MKIASFLCLLLVSFAPVLFGQNALDMTFDPGSGANSYVESMVVQSDGKILVCGRFSQFNGFPRNYIARLNADGSVDPTFDVSGTNGPNQNVRSMALQADNKIVIGGYFTSVSGHLSSLIARLNPDGTLDKSLKVGTGCYGLLGKAIDGNTNSFIFAVAIQPDQKILIGGNFTNYNGTVRNGIARLNPDGSLDASFDVGDGVNSWVRSILILPNDQILLAGWFKHYHNADHYKMVRVNPDGSADKTFAPWFGDPSAVYAMAVQGDKYIVSGHSLDTNLVFHQDIARVFLNGTNDLSFNPGGAGANDKVECVAVQPDGKILMSGFFTTYNNEQVRNFARLNEDGTRDTSLNVSANNWVWAVKLQSNNKILICGAFSSVNGVSRNGIARLNPSDDFTEMPPPMDPTNSLVAWLLDGSDRGVSVPILDRPETQNLVWRIKACGDINTNGQPDILFQNSTNGQIAAWVMDGTNFHSFKPLNKKLISWEVLGVGDLSGDGRSDILVRRTNGRLAVLTFSKGKFKGASMLATKSVSPKSAGLPRVTTSLLISNSWSFVGFNDFNGDLKNDLLWQDGEGRLVVWLMNNKKFLQWSHLGNGLVDGQAVALSDFNGDQQKDVLIQHANGKLSTWYLNGTNVLSSADLFANAQINAQWKIVGLNDLNGDGRNDLVWRTKP